MIFQKKQKKKFSRNVHTNLEVKVKWGWQTSHVICKSSEQFIHCNLIFSPINSLRTANLCCVCRLRNGSLLNVSNACWRFKLFVIFWVEMINLWQSCKVRTHNFHLNNHATPGNLLKCLAHFIAYSITDMITGNKIA